MHAARSTAARSASCKEYRRPRAALADGRLVVTFDPIDERQLNWRQYSRLSEAWLIANR